MIAMTLLGVGIALGLLALYRALFAPQPSLADQVARLDSGRSDLLWISSGTAQTTRHWNTLRRWLAQQLTGTSLLNSLSDHNLRVDLSLLGIDEAYFSAGRLMMVGAGFLAGPVLALVFAAAGQDVTLVLGSLVVALLFAVVGLMTPVRLVSARADTRRADFRAAITAYMDLVAMRAASGAGPSEALHDAAEIGQGWPFARVRLALRDARISGYGEAHALGHLGEEIGMPELQDLAAQLELSKLTGAQAETTLRERARSLRDAQLATAQGQAGKRSQSMIVAQFPLGAGFLLFILYPPLTNILTAF